MTQTDSQGLNSQRLGSIPAATIIIFRRSSDGEGPQLLFLERSDAMRFAGGAAVFPGGRVDEADRLLADRISHGLDREEAAARIAAIRETLEEAGLFLGLTTKITAEQAQAARDLLLNQATLADVLDRHGWQIDLSLLVPWARWCPDWKGAFDTRFYLADLGTGAVEVSKDDSENKHLFWAGAKDALAMADDGRISVIFPTRRNLERLAMFSSFAAARDHALATPIRTITPIRTDIDGVLHLTIPDDLGYPVTSETFSTVRRS